MPEDPVPPQSPPVPPANTEGDSALWLAEEWERQISRALESMTGEPVLITFAPRQLAPSEIDPAQQELLWWQQPLSLGSDSKIWVGAFSRSWQEIGSRVLRSAGVDDATADDVRSTYLEIVNQSLSGVASAISARVRKEISCVEGRAGPPELTAGSSAYAFEIKLGEQAFPLLAVFALSVANLSEAPAPPPAKPAPRERAPAANSAGSAAPPAP